MLDKIVIRGAREHNLKNISLEIPRNQLVVFTGLSGSGKSSLAFDTLYAEGQRRYLESLSAYARLFLEQLQRPNVDSIEGLSPSISTEQKTLSSNPRSTVGTVTEIYDFLRLLFARVGVPSCPNCGEAIQSQSPQEIATQVLRLPEGTKFAVLAPIVRGKKGEYQKNLHELRAKGFTRARIDGQTVNLSDTISLKKTLRHDISVYIDRLIQRPGCEARLGEAIELAIKLAEGLIEIEVTDKDERTTYSTKRGCPNCGTSFPELEPRLFSFNGKHGACPKCNGLGNHAIVDPDKVVPDVTRSLKDGAVGPWEDKSPAWLDKTLAPLRAKQPFSLETPFGELPERIQRSILYGSSGDGGGKAFEGVVRQIERQIEDWDPDLDDEGLENDAFLSRLTCTACQGTRLRKEALAVKIEGKSIAEVCEIAIKEARRWIAELKFTENQTPIAEPVLKEISSRLDFLDEVGLDYISLNRSAETLSGGEAQRIRLATQIGSSLVGVLYILDEPSIGLHQRDNEKLIGTLKKLRDLGNTVIVVEHDEDTIRASDFVVDLGPGAGSDGGHLVAWGTPDKLASDPKSVTGRYLSGERQVQVPQKRRAAASGTLSVVGATAHNLKTISVDFPLGLFTVVTGVSGSGKSTLVIDLLLPAVSAALHKRALPPYLSELKGVETIDRVIHVDQKPIGRTPRSNPATYTGLFGDIRNLFASLPDAKSRGYMPGRFSFNVAGGRCENCKGEGQRRITMNFLPDVYVECEVCYGKRYNRETLQVRYRGKNIAEVLGMTIAEGAVFFERIPSLRDKLKLLLDVGLGYITLGQSSVTLSGGEAQRIKLARELSRRGSTRTLYILDEPTTGLHFEDVQKLVHMLHALVDLGNTVVVIEHNLDVIKQADYLIELGPEGGNAGGEIVFRGTPEELAHGKTDTATAPFLRRSLAPPARG